MRWQVERNGVIHLVCDKVVVEMLSALMKLILKILYKTVLCLYVCSTLKKQFTLLRI